MDTTGVNLLVVLKEVYVGFCTITCTYGVDNHYILRWRFSTKANIIDTNGYAGLK